VKLVSSLSVIVVPSYADSPTGLQESSLFGTFAPSILFHGLIHIMINYRCITLAVVRCDIILKTILLGFCLPLRFRGLWGYQPFISSNDLL